MHIIYIGVQKVLWSAHTSGASHVLKNWDQNEENKTKSKKEKERKKLEKVKHYNQSAGQSIA